MANYSLVVNSVYNPFTFDELIKPYQMYGQAYKEQESTYNALMDKASVWEGMANETTDKKAYSQYKKYANDLKASADSLLANGLTPTSMGALNNMRRRYSSEIAPIETAYKNRAEQIKAQQQAMISDPTHMFAHNAATTSLDEYLNNPSYDALSQNYSGSLLTKQAAEAATHLSKTLQDYGKGKVVDAFTNTFVQRYGYKDKDVNAVVAALNDPTSAAHNTVLGQIANSVMESSGISAWNDKALTDKAWGYIGQGLYSAIGEDKVTPMENKAAVMAAENYYAQQRQQAEWNHAAEVTKQNDIQMTLSEMDPIKLGDVEKREAITNFEKAGYLKTANGKTVATPKSRQEYKKFIEAANGGGITIKQAMELASMPAKDAQEWINKNSSGGRATTLTKAFGISTPSNEKKSQVIVTARRRYDKNTNKTVPIVGGKDSISKGTEGNLRLAGQYAKALDELYRNSKSPLVVYDKGKDSQHYGYQPGNIGNLFAASGKTSGTSINESTAWRYHVDSSNQGNAVEVLRSDLGENSTFNVVNRDGSSAGTTFSREKLDNKNYKVTNFIMSPKGFIAEIQGVGENEGKLFYIDMPESDTKKAISKIFNNNEKYKKIYNQDVRNQDFANVAYESGLSDAYLAIAHMLRTNKAQAQTFVSPGTQVGNDWQYWQSQEDTDEEE